MVELKNYVPFTSTNPKLDFLFLYPGDWQAREVGGADYNEVSILGPRNREGTFSLALMVRVVYTGDAVGQRDSLERLVQDYLAHSKRSPGFREISRAYGSLAGVSATEIEIGYTIPLPINNVNAKQTPIIERRIFLLRGSHFYEVMYSAVEEDYYRYLEAFKNLVRTFEFRDDATPYVYRPLVMPAPAPALRERPSEYELRKNDQ